MEKKQQPKVCFTIDDETDAKVKALPRSFNLSQKLRFALMGILHDEHESHFEEDE